MNYSWVATTNWTFTASFATPAAVLAARDAATAARRGAVAAGCFLNLDGVDTISTVTLNGAPLGATDDLFKSFRFDVSAALAPAGANNTLVIAFENALAYAARAAAAYPYVAPETENYNVWAEPSHRNFVRKVRERRD